MGSFSPNKSSMSIKRRQSGCSVWGVVVTCDRRAKARDDWTRSHQTSSRPFLTWTKRSLSVFPSGTLEAEAWVRWIRSRFAICCFVGPEAWAGPAARLGCLCDAMRGDVCIFCP